MKIMQINKTIMLVNSLYTVFNKNCHRFSSWVGMNVACEDFSRWACMNNSQQLTVCYTLAMLAAFFICWYIDLTGSLSTNSYFYFFVISFR